MDITSFLSGNRNTSTSRVKKNKKNFDFFLAAQSGACATIPSVARMVALTTIWTVVFRAQYFVG
ncbi:MAG: hypothetical protein IIC04_00010 [Proteobacteria bacterium]|nr:hypothetical protein [Pseudomonadota bacterium]